MSAYALSVVYTLVLECVGDGVSLCSSVVCVLFVELLGWQCQFVPFWDLYSVRKVVGVAVSAYARSVAYTLVLECMGGSISLCSSVVHILFVG